MYPVSANFHTLAIQDAPKTRVRIYFIGDAVDCTDDNAVQTNGTLLIGKAGDTDSNGRIGQNGITFSEFFNPDKNIQVGAAVSSQIGMTLLNTDGALDNFQYGRCKVYLDVYDTANSSWLTCPMGVYIIDLPTKRKVQLVTAIGYDQMQKLDEICDTWWSALNWSGGITLSQLLTSLATQIGVSVSSNTASAIVNGSVSFTDEPFQCIEVTYREVLEYIAEATGTVARFDRNGALDLRWFVAAQISGNTVTVNTDTVGNQCLAISAAEYSVAAVDLLKVKLYTDDIGTTVGSGTNQYTIVNNLFLDGANSSAIIAKATPIYNRLHGLGAYSPVSARIITDWSIEAGDIINIVNDSTTYSVPIFQQSMAWRGGYVVSDLLSDGDNVRPVLDYDERTYYRLNSEMSKKVGDNEIISKINQSPESITIQANKVNLTGYVTFTNLSTSGQTTIDGGNITTGTIDASTVTVGNINASNISSGTLSADRIAAGSLAIGKLDSAAQNTINGANSQEQLIYRSKVAGTTSLSGTTTWVTNTTGNQDTWTLKRPTYNSSYPVLFIATQRKDVGGTVTCTTPQIDNTTTVIDGGNIITGTVTANQIAGGTITSTNLATALNNTINTAYSNASTALSNAATAQSTAESANSQEQLIYISKVSGTTSVSGTTTWVTNTTGNQNTWTIKRPVYNSSYPVLFVATQRKNVAGTVTCTTPQIDNTTTVIDGGHISTGTIDASVVSVTNLNASNITSGTMSASKISGGTLTLGGSNNTDGTMTVLDANGVTAATVDNAGITVNGTQTIGGSSKPTTLVLSDGSIVSQTNGENSFKVGRNSLGGGFLSIYKKITGVSGTLNNAGITFFDGTKPKIRYDYDGFSLRYDNGYGVTDSPAVRMYHDSAESNITFATPPGDSGASTVIGSAGSTFGSDATFSANATVNGVLDVTQRRCYAALSSAGWYRVLKIDGGTGVWSFSVDFDITRVYSNSNNEVHSVKMLKTYNTIPSFVNEASKTNILIVSKIRYTIDSNGVGYVDIRYDSIASNTVTVDFAVHTAPDQQQYFTAESLQSVADSPSGETVLPEYTFAANTLGPSIGQYSEAITSFSTSSALGGYYHAFINMESTLNIKPKNVLAVFTDYSTGANPVTGFTVNGDVNLLVSFANNTPCTVYITYLK